MEDVVLDERFEPKIRQYGRVMLDDDEKEALKLQPNFAMFEEVDELEFMAYTEKTLNSIRWNENNCERDNREARPAEETGGNHTTNERRPGDNSGDMGNDR